MEVLKKALEKAQMQAQTPPAETQIAQAILERAKKRMVGADEKIRQAAEALRQAESEKAADIQAVAEAEAFAERFESSVSTAFHYTTLSDPQCSKRVGSGSGEVACPSCTIARPSSGPSRCRKRRAVGSGRTVSTMPNTLILGEVSAWVEECHVVMLDAVNVGDRNRVFGVVELDRSKSGASDRVHQSRALSCVCAKGTLGMGSAV